MSKEKYVLHDQSVCIVKSELDGFFELLQFDKYDQCAVSQKFILKKDCENYTLTDHINDVLHGIYDPETAIQVVQDKLEDNLYHQKKLLSANNCDDPDYDNLPGSVLFLLDNLKNQEAVLDMLLYRLTA